jgi:hypothetical protein
VDQEVVYLARALGDELKTALQAIERQWQTGAVPEQFAPHIMDALSSALSRLSDAACWGPSNRIASNELWRIAEPWLTFGVMQVHARMKPRGYAGDYEMLEKICNRFCCDHPMGGVMDEFFQQQAAPQAVRDRTQILAQELLTHSRRPKVGAFRVVSVGSGSAREIRTAVAETSPEERSKWHITPPLPRGDRAAFWM